MAVLQLTTAEMSCYRDAMAAEKAQVEAGSPVLPKQTKVAMQNILKRRKIKGLADKVTVRFGGVDDLYELHYARS